MNRLCMYIVVAVTIILGGTNNNASQLASPIHFLLLSYSSTKVYIFSIFSPSFPHMAHTRQTRKINAKIFGIFFPPSKVLSYFLGNCAVCTQKHKMRRKMSSLLMSQDLGWWLFFLCWYPMSSTNTLIFFLHVLSGLGKIIILIMPLNSVMIELWIKQAEGEYGD